MAPPAAGPADRWRLALAAAAVLLAAADTYVVVVVLPNIMNGVGLGVDRLQRATPIISGFLLGYTVVLPLIGRLADLAGTASALGACLVAFGAGSVVTATAHSLPVVVIGRAVQGVGGGGLVPVTLAMVAARWPPDRRGTPLGIVGALQELGSVVGPLYGAAIVAVASWRAIFWVNIPVTIAVGAAFALAGRLDPPAAAPSASPAHRALSAGGRDGPPGAFPAVSGDPAAPSPSGSPAHRAPSAGGRDGPPGAFPARSGDQAAPSGSPARRALSAGSRDGRRDVVGPALAGVGAVVLALALDAPASLATSPTWGGWYVPRAAGEWASFTTPLAIAGLAAMVAALVWEGVAPLGVRPLLPLASARYLLSRADLPGAALLGGVLACVVVAFSSADPSRQVVASSAPVVGPLAALLALAFALRQRRARHPLIEPGSFRRRPAWGALVANLFLGGALMSALVDVPLFARSTIDPTSEVAAALVLLRFLVAVPIGAVAGGLLCRNRGLAGPVAAAGMALSTAAFLAMSSWSATALGGGPRWSDLELAACGLGFGLAVAPVNVAILGAVDQSHHALASALAVVARTIGMLAGLSALTAIALHRFYQSQEHIGTPLTLCPSSPGNCPAYDRATTAAILSELHTIFAGAAICAGVAAISALVLLSKRT